MADEIYEHLRERAPFKIEFIDKNDNYHRLGSSIKSIFEDHIFIYPPQAAETFPEIPENSEVNIIFNRNNGVLIAKCIVLDSEPEAEDGIKISFPYDVQILERREYVRVSLRLRTEIIYYPDELNRESLFVVTRNISGSGFCFIHKDSFEKKQDIHCKIYLNDQNPNPVAAKCVHIHSKKLKTRGDIYYLTALKYTSISDKDITRIVRECFKHQINQKHLKRD